MKQMQIDFAESVYASIPAGQIETDWAKLEYTTSACKLAIYISTILYDQSDLETRCAATAGCVFAPAEYTEYAVALKIIDETTTGVCYALDKISLGFYMEQSWADGHRPAAFHLVMDNGALT